MSPFLQPGTSIYDWLDVNVTTYFCVSENHKSIVTFQICSKVKWRLKMFANKMLRRKLQHKENKVRGERKKLLNGELHNLYFSLNTTKVTKYLKLIRRLNQEVSSWWATGQTKNS
jgi:hypothetical protein